MPETTCPACGGENNGGMGALGKLFWIRCRHCGMDYNIPVENLDLGDEDEDAEEAA